MTASVVHLAAYDSLDTAVSDWDDLDADCANGEVQLVDAALVEAVGQTIRTLHRFSTRCFARGSASVSVVGLLHPSSLVTGALAGGIGEQTIATLADGLDRDLIKQLGDTMDLGQFTIILIAGDGERVRPARPAPSCREWSRSIGSTAVVVATSTESIDHAVRLDDPLR